MLNKYIFNNPEIIRHVRTHLRYPKVLSFIVLYLLSLLSLYTLIFFTMDIGNPSKFHFEIYSKVIYVTTLGIEYMFYFYVGTYLISNSLAQEKERGTFDFIRLTVIERKVIAIGKLLGAPIFLTLLLLITFPFVIIAAVNAQISMLHFIFVHFNLIVYALLFHTLGLFSAVTLNRSASANGFALSFPILLTMMTLATEKKLINPFYSLFSALDKAPFTIRNGNFFGFDIPDFLLTGAIIIYLVIWFMIGLTRKLDSESNHSITKKQAVTFTAGMELIIIGLLWEKLAEGSTTNLAVFFILNFILLTIIIAILNPTREDILIYLNKPQDIKNKLWHSKSPVFNLVIILNIIVLIFGIIANLSMIISGEISYDNLFYTFALSIFLFLFTFIYSQIFYLSNIIFIKNASTITSLIIAISMFIPIPINFFTKSNGNFADLFLFNPFILFLALEDQKGLVNLANMSQVLILVIIILGLNVLYMSKQEETIRKYKL